MTVQSMVFAGSDIRVAELISGRYFNKADLLRLAGKQSILDAECLYLDILEATKLIGEGKEHLIEEMQLWAPHLSPNSVIELH